MDIFPSLRTVHCPTVEGDTAGRRESGWAGSVTVVNAASSCCCCVSFSTCCWAFASARNVECSQTRRLGFRPEFRTQLLADVRVAWKAERHLPTIKRNRQVRKWRVTVSYSVPHAHQIIIGSSSYIFVVALLLFLWYHHAGWSLTVLTILTIISCLSKRHSQNSRNKKKQDREGRRKRP